MYDERQQPRAGVLLTLKALKCLRFGLHFNLRLRLPLRIPLPVRLPLPLRLP